MFILIDCGSKWMMKRLLFGLVLALFCIMLVCWWQGARLHSVETRKRTLVTESLSDDLVLEPTQGLRALEDFDVSAKGHYFDPETAISAHGKPLTWVLEPFQPSADEFQVIARYESGLRQLNTSTSETVYRTREGQRRWRAELNRLRQELAAGLGKSRFDRYEYVLGSKSHYAPAWRVLRVNGIDEGRTQELLELADEYNHLVFGETIDHRDKSSGWDRPDYRRIGRIKRSTRALIREGFGEGVLQDILTLPSLDLFNGLGADVEGEFPDPWEDSQVRERLEDLYKVEFFSDESLPEHLGAAQSEFRRGDEP